MAWTEMELKKIDKIRVRLGIPKSKNNKSNLEVRVSSKVIRRRRVGSKFAPLSN